MCQYIHASFLPPLANAEELERIQAACAQSQTVMFKGTASEWLEKNSIPESALREAIIQHIKAGKKVFHKYESIFSRKPKKGKRELIPDDVQANVTISEGDDIYVEIWLESDDLITVYAHDHKPGPRLPQI